MDSLFIRVCSKRSESIPTATRPGPRNTLWALDLRRRWEIFQFALTGNIATLFTLRLDSATAVLIFNEMGAPRRDLSESKLPWTRAIATALSEKIRIEGLTVEQNFRDEPYHMTQIVVRLSGHTRLWQISHLASALTSLFPASTNNMSLVYRGITYLELLDLIAPNSLAAWIRSFSIFSRPQTTQPTPPQSSMRGLPRLRICPASRPCFERAFYFQSLNTRLVGSERTFGFFLLPGSSPETVSLHFLLFGEYWRGYDGDSSDIRADSFRSDLPRNYSTEGPFSETLRFTRDVPVTRYSIASVSIHDLWLATTRIYPHIGVEIPNLLPFLYQVVLSEEIRAATERHMGASTETIPSVDSMREPQIYEIDEGSFSRDTTPTVEDLDQRPERPSNGSVTIDIRPDPDSAASTMNPSLGSGSSVYRYQ